MITIYDVAKKSGYSITTVSKALNNYPDISEKARKKVLDACKELGFRPNSSARTLSTKKSWMVGVVFSEKLGVGITHPFFSRVIESFKKAVEAEGYDLLFISREIGNAVYTYLEHCNYRNVDGVIAVHADFKDPEVVELIESSLPMVVIDNMDAKALTVASENEAGTRLALEHLARLGHTRIAHICGDDDSYPSRIRQQAYAAAMRDLGLSVPKGYIQSGGFFSLEGGRAAMKRLLALPVPPSAVFASGDYMAIGAMEAIKEAGLSVPRDISVIGFDDVEAASLATPALTTVRQNAEAIGSVAARLLVDRVNGSEGNHSVLLPVALAERQSTTAYGKA